ncbi:MAG: class I SAM-dependent methyltransferase [Gammaproteobacteria bacterium]|nr:class I SAM-dependent methyltransferase [Gammaproteobacteria bacterium]MDH5512760.1 class I SAM-dependent methyltransferase [Gammaproteobacteria bacterium]
MKQHSPSCERNKEPILALLREIFDVPGLVLEIGSGSGQHAVHFARGLPHVTWQPTDTAENLASIAAWRAEAALPNLREPRVLDLFSDPWPVTKADALVCINTIHIVSWAGVEKLFAGAGRLLGPGGILYVYGPFRYTGRPLEPSNEDFDRWLKARDPVSGVRLFEDVNRLAARTGLVLAGDRAMPANNRSVWWVKE